MANTTQDLRQLDRDLFELAKWWEGATLACKSAGVLLGLVVILLGVLSKVAPFVAVVLALASEFCSWRAGHFQGMADGLLVKDV